MKIILSLLLTIALSAALPNISGASEKILIVGAGPSTKIVQLFFQEFAQSPAGQGYEFLIPGHSAKHAGGIKSSDTNLFGRTGRPLNQQERALNKDDIFLARIPIAFAVGSEVGLTRISLNELRDIYTRKITNWKQLGGQDAEILLVGREATEALFTTLKKCYPFFNDVSFERTFKKDHQVVNFLGSPEGKHAIGFGAISNFESLKTLEIEGFEAGVNLGLVYDLKFQSHPLVIAVKEFARKEEWTRFVTQAGLLAAD